MTDADLLAKYCTPVVADSDSWEFSSGYPRSRESALTIIRSCLALGVPVTDIVTAQTWFAVIERLVLLEQRVAVLEHDTAGEV